MHGVGSTRAKALLRAAALCSLLPALTACEWFTDFKEQPSVQPWESPSDTLAARGNPQLSVPTTGGGVSAFEVSYTPSPMTVDSMSRLTNPTQPTEASLRNGRMYYSINCAVCHGDNGSGNGAVTRYQPAFAINLLNAVTQNRTDGYLYGMIRNGRGVMPPYNRIEDMDRWDVVNYIRGLQGRLGAPVPIGPVGLPGETGDKLPGPSTLGPQRPLTHGVTPTGADTARGAAGAAAAPGAPAAHGANQPTISSPTTPRPPR